MLFRSWSIVTFPLWRLRSDFSFALIMENEKLELESEILSLIIANPSLENIYDLFEESKAWALPKESVRITPRITAIIDKYFTVLSYPDFVYNLLLNYFWPSHKILSILSSHSLYLFRAKIINHICFNNSSCQ